MRKVNNADLTVLNDFFDKMDAKKREEAALEAQTFTFTSAELDSVISIVSSLQREECARVCDEVGDRDTNNHAWDAAAAIRAWKGETDEQDFAAD